MLIQLKFGYYPHYNLPQSYKPPFVFARTLDAFLANSISKYFVFRQKARKTGKKEEVGFPHSNLSGVSTWGYHKQNYAFVTKIQKKIKKKLQIRATES